MRIEASVGKADKNADLRKRAYSLNLTARTEGDKQFIAALYRMLMQDNGRGAILGPEYDLEYSKVVKEAE